jgi:hypothetical protein
MLKFIASALTVTSICSLIKFSLNLWLMRYINPEEYTVYGIIVTFWGLVEIYVERGTQALTIKNGVNVAETINYIIEYIKKIVSIIAIGIIMYILFNCFSSLEINLIALIIFIAIGLGTLIKLMALIFEAKFINEGYYVGTQLKDLISTALIYIFAIWYISNKQIGGDLLLSLIFITQPLMYSLFNFRKIYSLKKEIINSSTLKKQIKNIYISSNFKNNEIFKKNSIKSASYEYAASKLDELIAYFIFNSNAYGNYLKFKDIGNVIAGFGSRIISRPWFYACSKYSRNEIKKIFISLCIIIAIIMIMGLFIPSTLYEKLIINILTTKWQVLASNGKILFQYSCFTFTYIFFKYTMIGIGAQSVQTVIDFRVFKFILINLILIYVINILIDDLINLESLIYLLIISKIYGINSQFKEIKKFIF